MSTCRVLHIDDVPEMRDALTQEVKRPGISIDSYEDSQEMLGKSPRGTYDLVVVDRSGFEAAKWLQQQDPSLRVVALTADDSTERRQDTESEGLRVYKWINKGPEWHQAIRQVIEEIAGARDPDSQPCMRECYDGDVVESFDGTAVVVYEVGDDLVEQIYEQSQFVGRRLPPKGARLRVHVEVSELRTTEAELPELITPEEMDDRGEYGPDKLTEPTDF